MNNLIVQISELLKMHEGLISLDLACETLGVTRRMLNYNLKKLNDILLNLNEEIVRIEEGNLTMNIDSAAKLEKHLINIKMENYIYSSTERRGLIFIIIALYPEVLTIDVLSELIGVSRSTLTSEITEIKNFYIDKNLIVEYLPTQGYIIAGHESEIRYKIIDILYSFENYVIKNITDEAILNWCSDISLIEKYKLLDMIENIITESEKRTQISYITSSKYELVRYILIICLRNNKGAKSEIYINELKFKEFKSAKYIVNKLQSHEIKIYTEEISYITSLLLGTKLTGLKNQPVEPEILKMSTFLLNAFIDNCMLETEVKEDTFEMFVIHIRSMIYRIMFNIKIDNSFTENVLPQFPFLTQWARLAANEFEKHYGIIIDQAEFIYLCIYFGSFIKKSSRSTEKPQKKVLIICGAGSGTSFFVKNQLHPILGEGYEYDIADFKHLCEINKQKYNLIVTTVDLENVNNYIKVNTVLTELQKLQILNWSLDERSETSKLNSISKIIEIVEKYADINDRVNLVCNLRKEFKVDNHKKVTFKEIFRENHFQVIEKKAEYKEAILLGCKPLIEDGIIGEEYCNEILQIINELGLYAEYVPGILLAHAKSDGHVQAVGITSTIFKNPVKFKNWNKEIKVIITLATYNTQAHLVALNELFDLLKNKTLLNLMLNYKEENKREIMQLFGIEEEENYYENLD